MENLKIFENEEFGKIRIVVIDNEPYFVGKDVASILGYSNVRDAIAKHVDEEDKGVAKCDTLGGKQNFTVINESGLYALIFGSKLESAKQFKHWVTSEVLPSIRKTGTYGMQPQGKELLALAVLEAQKIIEEQNQQIEEMKPKVQFADAITACDTSILIRDLAKLLRQNKVPTGEKRLYRWMRENGYIVKGTTQPTQRAMELGLFEVIERSIVRGDHLPQVKMTTKVTTKGQCYFINKILSESKKVNKG